MLLPIVAATAAVTNCHSGVTVSGTLGSRLPLGPFSRVRPPRFCREAPKSPRIIVRATSSKTAATRRVRVSNRSRPMKRGAASPASLCGRADRRIPYSEGRREQRAALSGTTVQVSLSNN